MYEEGNEFFNNRTPAKLNVRASLVSKGGPFQQVGIVLYANGSQHLLKFKILITART